MSIVFITLAVVTLLFLIILVIRRYREKLEHNAIMPFVDIMTIVIGIMSVITSAVSISVMKSQEKMQETLLQLQKEEHQPIFLVKQSIVETEEEFVIENVGEQMLAPAEIKLRSYLEVEYSNLADDIDKTVFFRVIYHNATTSSSNLKGVIKRSSRVDNYQNHLNYVNLTKLANRYCFENDGEHVFINQVDYFSISYTDIYGDKHTKYYRDSQLTTKEEFEKVDETSHATYGEHHTKPIAEVSLRELILPLKNK